MSVVIVVVVVDTKIASGQSRHLINLKVKLICRNQQKKELASVYFKSFGTGHECHK